MSEKNNESKYATVSYIGGKEAYEGKVALEALKRAGCNQNLKGIVHEVMIKDGHNINPLNAIKGSKAVFTESTTAVRDDILMKQAGKVAGRIQAKDTPGSILETVNKVKSGQYHQAKLFGTKETVKGYNSYVTKCAKEGTVKITKEMKSSGISSETTKNIANKALGKMPTTKGLTMVAKKAGIAGVLIAAGVEAVSSAGDVANGRITKGQYVGSIAKTGAIGGVSASAGSVASTVVTGAVATVAASTAPAWVPIAAGVGAAVLVGSAVHSGVSKVFTFFS